MKSVQKRVLIALGWYDYRLHRGIEKYAMEHNWHLTANLAREKVIPWGWEGHGILAWLGAGDDLARFVQQARKPTVDFSWRRPDLKFARVVEDHFHAAELVAEHFLARGFSNFMFYSDADNWSYEERGQGFTTILKRSNYDCTWLRWHKSSAYRTDREQWRQKRNWLFQQIKRAAKPLAIFAANDEQALDVLESCENHGIAVPEEVAIVGAENNLMAPDANRTPISSVDTNLETLGYRGAALLQELMSSRTIPSGPIRVPASGLIIRKSSDLLAVNHPGVAKGLRFMWQHCHETINVNDLVSAAMMSRRGLQKAFWLTIGRTPGQELRRVRIDRARKLLAVPEHKNYKMETLSRMCGFPNPNSFCVTFKRMTGMSPREYRNSIVR